MSACGEGEGEKVARVGGKGGGKVEVTVGDEGVCDGERGGDEGGDGGNGE